MIVDLIYNLPEENFEFNVAVNSLHYYAALSDIVQYLRSLSKYSNRPDVEMKVIHEVYDKVRAIIHEDNELEVP